MIGRPAFAAENARFDALARRPRPLISVHRGTGRGSIAENTAKAVRAAVAEGADIVEIDVLESTDGVFYLFHNGYEHMHFRVERKLETLTSAQIDRLQYGWVSAEKYPPERLENVLTDEPGTILNIDRSWGSWPALLQYLDRFDCTERVLLKTPPRADPLRALQEHPVGYPFMPIVRTREEAQGVIDTDDINTVALELVAPDASGPFTDRTYLESVQSQGLLVCVNALNLTDRVPLFAGWDDETSVLGDPDQGWGRLLDLRVDVILTDWPMLLRQYIDRRAERGWRPGRGGSSD